MSLPKKTKKLKPRAKKNVKIDKVVEIHRGGAIPSDAKTVEISQPTVQMSTGEADYRPISATNPQLKFQNFCFFDYFKAVLGPFFSNFNEKILK